MDRRSTLSPLNPGSQILDGNCLQEGDPVQFVKVYDDRRGKERAEQVGGGVFWISAMDS